VPSAGTAGTPAMSERPRIDSCGAAVGPWNVAVSIAIASTAVRSSRTNCSASIDDWRRNFRVTSVRADTVFGWKSTVPIVWAVEAGALPSATHEAVAAAVCAGMLKSDVMPVRKRAPALATTSRLRSSSIRVVAVMVPLAPAPVMSVRSARVCTGPTGRSRGAKKPCGDRAMRRASSADTSPSRPSTGRPSARSRIARSRLYDAPRRWWGMSGSPAGLAPGSASRAS